MSALRVSGFLTLPLWYVWLVAGLLHLLVSAYCALHESNRALDNVDLNYVKAREPPPLEAGRLTYLNLVLREPGHSLEDRLIQSALAKSGQVRPGSPSDVMLGVMPLCNNALWGAAGAIVFAVLRRLWKKREALGSPI